MKKHPPQAPQKNKILPAFKKLPQDHYFWLRDVKDPDTLKYLKEENAYFAGQMKALAPVTNRFFQKLKKRIVENEESYPVVKDSYEYWSRYKKGKNYTQQLRRNIFTKKEEVLIDFNDLARGKKFFSTSGLSLSPDQTKFAVGLDFNGSEKYRVRVRDIVNKKWLKDELPETAGGLEWGENSQVFYYTKLDSNHRPYQVWRHLLGTPLGQDELIFEESDPRHYVGLSKTTSSRYILIVSAGKITHEVHLLRADDPQAKPRCFQKRIEGLEYSVDHHRSEFVVLSNLKAQEFDLRTCPEEATESRHWKLLIAADSKIFRDEIQVFDSKLVVLERENGLPQIRVFDFKTKKSKRVSFPEEAYAVRFGAGNSNPYTAQFRLNYSSPILPPSTLELDLDTLKLKTLQTKKVPGHDPRKYSCRRVWAKSHDGTKVPMTLVTHKKHKGPRPAYVYGYGSYGMSVPDGFFRQDVFPLIDQGFLLAITHPRGGGEMGRQWYDNGKFLKKKNTFLDFIACSEHLVKMGLTKPKQIAIVGGSAGGMLVGACMNSRPELFGAVCAHVPFVDVLNTMLDDSLPLTPMEFKEWGNPKDPKYRKYIQSYSPYDNVVAQDYPALFVTAGLSDPRVTYWEPAKWVAKLRELKTDKNKILFKVNMGAGHQGASGRFEELKETAEEYAFLLNELKR